MWENLDSCFRMNGGLTHFPFLGNSLDYNFRRMDPIKQGGRGLPPRGFGFGNKRGGGWFWGCPGVLSDIHPFPALRVN
jgi:hypothetical protein